MVRQNILHSIKVVTLMLEQRLLYQRRSSNRCSDDVVRCIGDRMVFNSNDNTGSLGCWRGINTDNQSADLTLAMANSSHAFNAHGMDEDINPSSTAWLDNGTYAVRQPHTSNSTDALFSQQLKLSPNSSTHKDGAVLRHHDWLYSRPGPRQVSTTSYTVVSEQRNS